jgi:hypothetical protein
VKACKRDIYIWLTCERASELGSKAEGECIQTTLWSKEKVSNMKIQSCLSPRLMTSTDVLRSSMTH